MDIFFCLCFYWGYWLVSHGPSSLSLSEPGVREPGWDLQGFLWRGEWIPTDCCLRPTCRDSPLCQAMGTWSYTTSDHNRHWPLAGCTILLSLVLLPKQAVDTKYPVEQEDFFFPSVFQKYFSFSYLFFFFYLHPFFFFFKPNKCKSHLLSFMS